MLMGLVRCHLKPRRLAAPSPPADLARGQPFGSGRPAEPSSTGAHAAEPDSGGKERQRHYPQRLAPYPDAAEHEQREPYSDEHADRPAGGHEPGCEEERRQSEHGDQSQPSGHVLGNGPRVSLHSRIVARQPPIGADPADRLPMGCRSANSEVGLAVSLMRGMSPKK